ncbi:hypothetical protein EMIHUDRAFT_226431 [Emiliania huxleyi CCMP1516]|uniref:Uncharacterized protein n=2 Tax=Emiliania huxleyi TaxID=2903 RepID=A0A0D3KKW1_EMIH1|nr:hypothetical protein EMIHUDRAFT_226431 [Emiliania huxleyi CCMP1516]EOD36396.1 hypothetical protein EMIHUDRAFT_226431 [Emiliania huxleyi CCMP1516]|eukprot:XP_005788825.1 hypothetical protein EMIHUDRAFT_226431 [Emiliania huxleyi CCMP1516]
MSSESASESEADYHSADCDASGSGSTSASESGSGSGTESDSGSSRAGAGGSIRDAPPSDEDEDEDSDDGSVVKCPDGHIMDVVSANFMYGFAQCVLCPHVFNQSYEGAYRCGACNVLRCLDCDLSETALAGMTMGASDDTAPTGTLALRSNMARPIELAAGEAERERQVDDLVAQDPEGALWLARELLRRIPTARLPEESMRHYARVRCACCDTLIGDGDTATCPMARDDIIANEIQLGYDEAGLHRSARYVFYRQFIAMKYGHLGAGVRIRLPDCVVAAIRCRWPEPSCTCDHVAIARCTAHGYTGFRAQR